MTLQNERRSFLKKAAAVAAAIAILPGGMKISGRSVPAGPEAGIPLLNPAFRINTFRDGSVEIFTYDKNRHRISHTFRGDEAIVLKHIALQETPSHQLHVERNMPFLNEMESSGIVYFGERMLVKIEEA